MPKLFPQCRRLMQVVAHLFSKSAARSATYDDRDLVLGHGVDNLPAMRVVVGLSLAVLLAFWVDMLLRPQLTTVIAFSVLLLALCHYAFNLPRAGITDSLNHEALSSGQAQEYRSYLGGRILFTPNGLSLSWHRRVPPNVAVAESAAAAVAANAATADAAKAIEDTASTAQTQQQIASTVAATGVVPCDEAVAKGLLAATADKTDLPVVYSGYIQTVKTTAFIGKRLYPGVPLPLSSIQALIGDLLPQLSRETHLNLLPSDVCIVGFGYPWKPIHTRRIQELMEVGLRGAPANKKGSPDIHAVEDRHAFEPISLLTEALSGHTLILGTTGAGKTRLYDELGSEAITRGDTVIFIDPKGDRDLKKSIVRAARYADRDPLDNVYVLDIGRPLASPLISEMGQHALLKTMGQHSPVGGLSHSQLVAKRGDISAEARSQLYAEMQQVGSFVPQEQGSFPSALQHTPATLRAPLYGYAPLMDMEPDSASANCSDAALAGTESLRQRLTQAIAQQQQLHSTGKGKTRATSASASASSAARGQGLRVSQLSAAVKGIDDAAIMDYLNTGFSPFSVFDRATEIGDRLTAMMPDAGSAASFKAYANMAVSAAVECCVLTGQKVTLARIRHIVSHHEAFGSAIRTYLNQLVIRINLPEVSIYFNRLHGIKNQKLQRNCYAVTMLLGAHAEGAASLSKEQKIMAALQEEGYVSSAEDESLEDSVLEISPEDLERVMQQVNTDFDLIEESSSSHGSSAGTTATGKGRTRSRTKVANCAAPLGASAQLSFRDGAFTSSSSSSSSSFSFAAATSLRAQSSTTANSAIHRTSAITMSTTTTTHPRSAPDRSGNGDVSGTDAGRGAGTVSGIGTGNGTGSTGSSSSGIGSGGVSSATQVAAPLRSAPTHRDTSTQSRRRTATTTATTASGTATGTTKPKARTVVCNAKAPQHELRGLSSLVPAHDSTAAPQAGTDFRASVEASNTAGKNVAQQSLSRVAQHLLEDSLEDNGGGAELSVAQDAAPAAATVAATADTAATAETATKETKAAKRSTRTRSTRTTSARSTHTRTTNAKRSRPSTSSAAITTATTTDATTATTTNNTTSTMLGVESQSLELDAAYAPASAAVSNSAAAAAASADADADSKPATTDASATATTTTPEVTASSALTRRVTKSTAQRATKVTKQRDTKVTKQRDTSDAAQEGTTSDTTTATTTRRTVSHRSTTKSTRTRTTHSTGSSAARVMGSISLEQDAAAARPEGVASGGDMNSGSGVSATAADSVASAVASTTTAAAASSVSTANAAASTYTANTDATAVDSPDRKSATTNTTATTTNNNNDNDNTTTTTTKSDASEGSSSGSSVIIFFFFFLFSCCFRC